MKKVLSALTYHPATLFSVVSLLMSAKVGKSAEQVNVQPQERTESPNQTMSASELKPCARHEKKGEIFCAKSEHLSELSKVRKGVPEIDTINLSEKSQKQLLNVTDEESDAAVAIFGCDCPDSINCLRRLRNQLP
jgi:hypothetical protein